MAIYEVPVDKFIDNRLGTDRVVGHNVVDGLIRKYDAPPESIIGLVALINLNFMLGITQLHTNAKVKPRGTPTYTDHFHKSFSANARNLNTLNLKCRTSINKTFYI